MLYFKALYNSNVIPAILGTGERENVNWKVYTFIAHEKEKVWILPNYNLFKVSSYGIMKIVPLKAFQDLYLF